MRFVVIRACWPELVCRWPNPIIDFAHPRHHRLTSRSIGTPRLCATTAAANQYCLRLCGSGARLRIRVSGARSPLRRGGACRMAALTRPHGPSQKGARPRVCFRVRSKTGVVAGFMLLSCQHTTCQHTHCMLYTAIIQCCGSVGRLLLLPFSGPLFHRGRLTRPDQSIRRICYSN